LQALIRTTWIRHCPLLLEKPTMTAFRQTRIAAMTGLTYQHLTKFHGTTTEIKTESAALILLTTTPQGILFLRRIQLLIFLVRFRGSAKTRIKAHARLTKT